MPSSRPITNSGWGVMPGVLERDRDQLVAVERRAPAGPGELAVLEVAEGVRREQPVASRGSRVARRGRADPRGRPGRVSAPRGAAAPAIATLRHRRPACRRRPRRRRGRRTGPRRPPRSTMPVTSSAGVTSGPGCGPPSRAARASRRRTGRARRLGPHPIAIDAPSAVEGSIELTGRRRRPARRGGRRATASG